MEDRARIKKLLRTVDPNAAESQPAADPMPSRLLPGEDLATPYLEEAEHWEAVYGELEHFIESLLEGPPQTDEAAPDRPSRDHVEGERLLQVNLRDLRAHRRYWEQRRHWIASRGGLGRIMSVDYSQQG